MLITKAVVKADQRMRYDKVKTIKAKFSYPFVFVVCKFPSQYFANDPADIDANFFSNIYGLACPLPRTLAE